MVRHTFLVAAARFTSAAFQALLLLMLARALGPGSFGAFVVSIAWGNALGLLTGLGSTAQVLRLGANSDGEKVSSTLLALRSVSAVLAAAGGAAVHLLYSGWSIVALAAGVWIFVDLNIDLIQATLFGRKQFGRGSWLLILRRVLPSVAVVFASFSGAGIWMFLMYSQLISLLLSILLVVQSLHMPGKLLDRVRESRHYWLSTVLAGLQTTDTIIVGAASPSAALVGNFAVASRLTSPLNMVASSVLSVLTPQMSSASSEERDRLLQLGVRMMVLLGLLLAILTWPLSEAFVFLVGDAYRGAQPIVVGALLAVGLNAVSQVLASYYYSSLRVSELSRIRVVTAPVGLLIIAGASVSGSAALLGSAVVAAQFISVSALWFRIGKRGSASRVQNVGQI